jgi:hypothetical protein
MIRYTMSPSYLYDTTGWRFLLAKHRRVNGGVL